MDQMQMLLWHERTVAAQRERSRVAHSMHVRAEQARQARDAQPSAAAFLGRAWKAVTGGTRRSMEPTALAPHQW